MLQIRFKIDRIFNTALFFSKSFTLFLEDELAIKAVGSGIFGFMDAFTFSKSIPRSLASLEYKY